MYRRYETFLRSVKAESDLVEELHAIRQNEEEIALRFATELSFGTAGLRGILGVGTGRMNVYTVSRATNGLFDVISARTNGQRPRFLIGYDTRKKSDLFARRAAEVLAGRGALVYLASEPIPVPLVSFATQNLGCDAGICITASHNPAVYNGYKVFGPGGSQLLEDDCRLVEEAAKTHDYFEEIAPFDEDAITPIAKEVFDTYFARLSERLGVEGDASLRVVYTPLCGTGLRFVPRALTENGFAAPLLVEEQAVHDGSFPTCPKPNPEEKDALSLALSLAKEEVADLLIATDPDCDRIGVGVRDGEDYRLLSGNELGLLLLSYVLRRRKMAGTLTPDSLAVTTIVSARMADALCADYGVRLERTLTGFKYIGEWICKLKEEGKQDDFLFGFEESYGCVISTDVRDKDACEAALFTVALATELKREGKTLVDLLTELETRYGVYRTGVKNVEFSGLDAEEKRRAFMRALRENAPATLAGERVLRVTDCLLGVSRTSSGEETPLTLPRADVLSFETAEDTCLMVRPSGTEPKIKFYLFTCGETEAQAMEKLSLLREDAEQLL